MSTTMLAKAKLVKTGSVGRKLVMMILADISDDTGYCSPNYDDIANICEISCKSVKIHITNLVKHGFINENYQKTKKNNPNCVPTHRLLLDDNRNFESKIIDYAFEGSSAKQENNLTELPSSIDITLMEDYIKMRNSIGKPMTQRAINLVIKKLIGFVKLGQNGNKIIKNSILNNWQSVYPEKKEMKSSKNINSIYFNSRKTTQFNYKSKKAKITNAVLDVHNTDW